MSIIVNNGVANIKETPGIIADTSSNFPIVDKISEGTIFISTTDGTIWRAQSGGWVLLGGGQSIYNLQQVVDATSSPVLKLGIIWTLIDTTDPLFQSIWEQYAGGFTITSTQNDFQIQYDILQFQGRRVSTGDTFTLSNFYTKKNNQLILYPEDSGTISLQDPPFISTISSTPFTPLGTRNGIYRTVAGASSIVLNPANWDDRKTVTFCVDQTFTFSATGGATIKGNAFVNKTGLFYATFLKDFNTFYISHV